MMEKKLHSYSRINQFFECPYSYLLGLQGFSGTNEHLEMGKLVHSTMEAPIENLEGFLDTVNEADNLGKYTLLQEKFPIVDIAKYLLYVRTEVDKLFVKRGFVILEKEWALVDTELNQKGFIDFIAYNQETKTLCIGDYKTYSREAKSYEELFESEQLNLYIYLLFRDEKFYAKYQHLEVDAIKIGYVSIPKSEPLKPRILKNGSLSKAKGQNTTPELFLEAIEENGLDVSEYQEFIDYLEDENRSKFEFIEYVLLWDNCEATVGEYFEKVRLVDLALETKLFPKINNHYKCGKCLVKEHCKK